VVVYRLTRPFADRGCHGAQHVLGTMYLKGKGVPQNEGQTAKWFRLAADQGDSTAQFELGRMYYDGQGVPQS
jgi:TPR repeat protein